MTFCNSYCGKLEIGGLWSITWKLFSAPLLLDARVVITVEATTLVPKLACFPSHDIRRIRCSTKVYSNHPGRNWTLPVPSPPTADRKVGGVAAAIISPAFPRAIPAVFIRSRFNRNYRYSLSNRYVCNVNVASTGQLFPNRLVARCSPLQTSDQHAGPGEVKNTTDGDRNSVGQQ